MGLAAVVLAGAVFSANGGAFDAPRAPLSQGALDAATANIGLAVSHQAVTSSVRHVTVVSGGASRTGHITVDGAAIASGVQAVSLTTGLGSTGQALVSIVGGVTLVGARP